jgi:hypothetical protein
MEKRGPIEQTFNPFQVDNMAVDSLADTPAVVSNNYSATDPVALTPPTATATVPPTEVQHLHLKGEGLIVGAGDEYAPHFHAVPPYGFTKGDDEYAHLSNNSSRLPKGDDEYAHLSTPSRLPKGDEEYAHLSNSSSRLPNGNEEYAHLSNSLSRLPKGDVEGQYNLPGTTSTVTATESPYTDYRPEPYASVYTKYNGTAPSTAI